MSSARTIEDGVFYHLYNRGNHKEAIFHRLMDYERFLWAMSDAAAEFGVDVAAYCLMPNHYHALVRQHVGGSLSQMMRSFTVSFVKYYNGQYGQVGHLFQGTYNIRRIRNEADLIGVSRYIHRNPVEFAALDEFKWSSYRAYLGEPSRFCDPSAVLQAYREWFGDSYAIFCNSVKNFEIPGGY